MGKKTLFEPGDLVKSFTGQNGLVISTKTFDKIRDKVKQGRRPGHFFAAGCPDNIDYLLQVPVFFEDGTYDIMKPMNIKKASGSAEGWTEGDLKEKRSKLEEMLQNI
ncbi:MAG: hypothetical protein JRF06_01910 [Deltaproteobacteria bacterium]|nr:hypothetical protein [Deltaproteobacteria bacterium]MBW2333854.1 hypothetical protein [Deltaproteobacteria bacterium]